MPSGRAVTGAPGPPAGRTLRRTPGAAGVREVWDYRGLIANFASRELKAKYKKSALGWSWSLLNPVATLLTYSLVFGLFLRFGEFVPVAGNGELKNFAIYLFTGLVVWNFFYAVTTGAMGALVGAGPLLQKIYFPPYAPVTGNALATLSQLGIEVGLLIVVFAVLGNLGWTVLLVPLLVALLACFALGIGLFLSLLNVHYRDVSYLVGIGLNLLFYSAPIIYPLSLVTEGREGSLLVDVYQLNPVTRFVEAFRDCLYGLTYPGVATMSYITVWSLATLSLGWLFFSRGARDVTEEL